MEKHFLQTGLTVKDMKKHLAVKFGKYVDVDDIDIVCLEEGTIHKDSTHVVDIPRPLQVMVGNPGRKAYLITMSCGHSTSKI